MIMLNLPKGRRYMMGCEIFRVLASMRIFDYRKSVRITCTFISFYST